MLSDGSICVGYIFVIGVATRQQILIFILRVRPLQISIWNCDAGSDSRETDRCSSF